MRKNSTDESLAMNAADLAAALRISKSQVFKMVAKGVLPRPIKLGTMTSRWSRANVESFINNQSK